jgi:hypothetical protein
MLCTITEQDNVYNTSTDQCFIQQWREFIVYPIIVNAEYNTGQRKPSQYGIVHNIDDQ